MFLVAKTPTLLNSNLPEAEAASSPESGAARCRTSRQKRRFPHRILTNGHGVRHPKCKRWWGTGWLLTGFTGLTGLRGEGGGEGGTRKTRKSRGERGGERGTPIGGKATLTLRQHHCTTLAVRSFFAFFAAKNSRNLRRFTRAPKTSLPRRTTKLHVQCQHQLAANCPQCHWR